MQNVYLSINPADPKAPFIVVYCKIFFDSNGSFETADKEGQNGI